MVEMAIVLPFFLLLVLGMIDTARLIQVEQILTVACREGCRVAATNGKTFSDVTARVNSDLTAAGLNPSDVTMPPPPITATAPPLGTPITLTLSIPFNKVSYMPTPFLFGSMTITVSATMSSERPPP